MTTEIRRKLLRIYRQARTDRLRRDPALRAKVNRYTKDNAQWHRDIRIMLGLTDQMTTKLPTGMTLVNALQRRALDLLAMGADAEVVYRVWAEWQTLRRLALVKAGLVGITPREDA